jgi:hypothetical protein
LLSQFPGTEQLTKIHFVIYQHQHAPLPFAWLKDVPQPVVVLLEKLLEKDPAQGFQTPDELLKAIATITDAVDARRRITRQGLLNTPSTASRVRTRKPPAQPDKISLGRLPVTGSEIFGREEDIAFLDRAWGKKEVNVVTNRCLGLGSGNKMPTWREKLIRSGDMTSVRTARQSPIFEQK